MGVTENNEIEGFLSGSGQFHFSEYPFVTSLTGTAFIAISFFEPASTTSNILETGLRASCISILLQLRGTLQMSLVLRPRRKASKILGRLRD